MCLCKKFTHWIFAAQIPDARPFDLIFFGQRSKGKFYFDSEFFICFLVSSNLRFSGVRWHTKNAMCLSAFFCIFLCWCSRVNYLFFCLDAKEPKNQGSDALLTICLFFIWCSWLLRNSLKMVCTALKCKKLWATLVNLWFMLKQFTFFNAHSSRPMCVFQRSFYLT